MKNKSIYMSKSIKALLISFFLLIAIHHNQDSISRIIMLPFLLCALFSLGKNIFLYLGKNKIAAIFSKLFILTFFVFWFGFLIVWCFYVIKKKDYLLLGMTIPFWIIGIYMACKFLFGVKKLSAKESKVNVPILISSLLVISVLSIGIFCLFSGIYESYQFNQKTKDYFITEGYLKDYHCDQATRTCQLIYSYEVNGKEYTRISDFNVGSEFVPKINSKTEIKYHVNNPAEASLSKANKAHFLIYFGAFFTLGGSVFVVAFLYIKGVFDKVTFNVMSTYVGIVCVLIGIGILLFQNEITLSLSDTLRSLKIWILIPILFVTVGIYLMIKSLFFEKKRKMKKD